MITPTALRVLRRLYPVAARGGCRRRGAALGLLARPTPGTLALAAMVLVATLGLLGWSVVDVLTAADWLAGRVHVGEPHP